MKARLFLLLSTPLILTMIGCTPLLIGNKTNTVDCLPPLVQTFSFSRDGYETVPFLGEKIPPAPWKQVINIPQPLPVDELSYTLLEPQFASETNGGREIWIINSWSPKKDSGTSHSIYVYQTTGNKWREVPGIIQEGPYEIMNVFLGTDGMIWAVASQEVGQAHEYSPSYTKLPSIIGKYNEKENKFQPVNFPQKVPLGGISFDGNQFWIFEKDGSIYALDPKIPRIINYSDPKEAEWAKDYEVPENFIFSDNSLAFMKDGSFYFLNETPRYYTYNPKAIALAHFVPATNSLQNIPINLENGPLFYNLFADRVGNLWLSDQGYMDKDGRWHEIIRSPVFITTKMEGTPIVWERPKIVLESSDGFYWFDSTNGMVSLDPQKGEWCWFTTYRSTIIEDSAKTLWMIADGKLFMKQLNR